MCLRTMSKHIFVYEVIGIKRGEKAVGLSKERLAMTALNLFSVRLCRRRVMRTHPSGTTLSELSGKWGRGKAPIGNPGAAAPNPSHAVLAAGALSEYSEYSVV